MHNPNAPISPVYTQNPNAPAPPARTVCTVGNWLCFMGVGCLIVGVIFAALPKSEFSDGVVGGCISLAFTFFVALSCRWCGWCRPHNTTTIVYNYGSAADSQYQAMVPGHKTPEYRQCFVNTPLVMPAHSIDAPSYTSNAASWC